MFRPAFGCCKHPKAGRNTQQTEQHISGDLSRLVGGRVRDCVVDCKVHEKPVLNDCYGNSKNCFVVENKEMTMLCFT